jgi:hypothetical protein
MAGGSIGWPDGGLDGWMFYWMAGWWTGWLDVLLDGRMADWTALDVRRVFGIAEEWTCKQDGFIYKYTYILNCIDIVRKIRIKYSQK